MVTLSIFSKKVGFNLKAPEIENLKHRAEDLLAKAVEAGTILDFRVLTYGDNLSLLFSHERAAGSEEIKKLSSKVFSSIEEIAKELKLGESGNEVSLEIEFEERPRETFAVLLTDRAEPHILNKIFLKLLENTPELRVEIHDMHEKTKAQFSFPQDSENLKLLLSSTRFVVKRAYGAEGIVFESSIRWIDFVMGKVTGNEPPIAIVRTGQSIGTEYLVESVIEPMLVWSKDRARYVLPCSIGESIRLPLPRIYLFEFSLRNGIISGEEDLLKDIAPYVRPKIMELDRSIFRRVEPLIKQITEVPELSSRLESLKSRFYEIKE